MKPQSEWGPADEFVATASTTVRVCFVLLLVGMFSYGAFSAISESYRRHVEWKIGNHAGFIGCVDGHIEVNNVTFQMPASLNEPVLNLNAVNCPAHKETNE